MKGSHWITVVAVVLGVAIVAILAGMNAQSALVLALAAACPIAMVVMMRGRGSTRGKGGRSEHESDNAHTH